MLVCHFNTCAGWEWLTSRILGRFWAYSCDGWNKGSRNNDVPAGNTRVSASRAAHGQGVWLGSGCLCLCWCDRGVIWRKTFVGRLASISNNLQSSYKWRSPSLWAHWQPPSHRLQEWFCTPLRAATNAWCAAYAAVSDAVSHLPCCFCSCSHWPYILALTFGLTVV